MTGWTLTERGWRVLATLMIGTGLVVGTVVDAVPWVG